MTPEVSDQLRRLDVSRETEGALAEYVALLTRWTRRINLVARGALPDIWRRHVIDSVQVFTLADPVPLWIDLGSGGGFPGIVAAICAREHWRNTRFTLIESDQRKAAFLRTAIRDLDLNATVLAERIETAAPQSADILSARALTDLHGLLAFAEKHLAPNGRALFPKGARWQNELAAAQQAWRFQAEAIRSVTHEDSVILRIKGISRG